MKTTTGSLVKRGRNFYCFWRISGNAHCRVLRDEAGQAITRKDDAERAKAEFMAIIGKQNKVEALRAIAHKIDDTNADIAALEDAQHPALPLALAWTAFVRSSERHDCSAANLGQYESKWEIFREWLASKHPDILTLRDVSSRIAEEFLQHLSKTLSASTYNYYLHTLRYVFRTVKEEAKLTEDVWAKAKNKTMVQFSRRELTIDELKLVCSRAQGEMKLLFCIGIYTGLRLGDCCTLKWGEVDLRRLQIRRIPNKLARRSPRPIVIPIHPVLTGFLSEIPVAEHGIYVLPKWANTYLGPGRSAITDQLQKHFRACGIQTTEKRENGHNPIVRVGFHSLRHTFVSMCRESNAPLSVVQSIVGHSSPQMTQLYTHTSELAAGRAVALLPYVMGDAKAHGLQTEPENILFKVQKIAKSMTAANWKTKRAELLDLVSTTKLSM
jgi:integrase